MSVHIHILNVLWILSNLHPCVSAVVCEGLKGLTCCSGFAGYVWNQTVHNCTSCMSGFYGENCASSCLFPYYGIRCGSKCNCSEEECHHQYGCKRRLGECDPGIYGRYCELTCRYPGFGKDCQMKCECEEQNCNPIKGCILAAGTDQVTDLDLTRRNDGFCGFPKDSKHKRTIFYISIVLGTVAGLQLIAYIWLSFYRPTVPQRSELPI
ncbi:scavenger receptor class F member 2-like isoform X2 [Ostrea edulis]|uniref:scavenger receptor class F member 2-like isoform X2 n=1 Tax=Ostrea edulis TaxID=37623 RepID=UPI0024AE8CF6|nr:scavenger receptor class F member 2-like isoform X2 [Ostrea edulis]